MAGLFSSLNASVKALTAHSRALETTGKNLANVNNPSYARQRVILGDRGTVATPHGAQSLGLEALGIQQLRDSLLDRQVSREISLRASFESEQQGYQRAQAGLGQGIDRSNSAGGVNAAAANGISPALDEFFNAFQSFAASPTDAGERQGLMQKTAILMDRFHLADQRLAQVQSDLSAQVSEDVGEANRLLSTIAELNGQIGRFESGAPGSAVDLRDQRQARIEELAAKLPIEVREAGGQVQILTKSSGGADVLLVDLATVNGTVAFTGTQVTAGSPATVLGLASGSMQGSLTARDGAVATLRTDLDNLAHQMVTSVNALYNPTTLTGNFFNAAGITAGTIAIDASVTAANLKASDGGPAGDNTVALGIARLAQVQFSTSGPDYIDGTFGGFFSTSVSRLGQSLSAANARVDDQTNIETLVRTQRDGTSGVSLDEEMADLMKFQRSFQASSRVFTVIDELLDLVVNRLGR
ncbi:MAG TPA: flagellar hook-associated protein FlgK [Opitutaceae bacterium]|nr:flagellar hook-associated protein FlgK [Opitutaceae bacterium]